LIDQQTQALFQQGIAAAKARQNDQACEALLQVVELDEDNVQAWLWLSTVMDDLEDRIICLQNVLELDPSNQHAQVGLAKLAKQADASQSELVSASAEESTLEEEFPSPHPQGSPQAKPIQKKRTGSGRYKRLSPQLSTKPDHLQDHASTAGALLSDSLAAQASIADAPSESADEHRSRNQAHASMAGAILKDSLAVPAPADREAPEDVFGDKYLCPRCAAKTRPKDKKCGHCGYKLWVKKRLQEKPSFLYRLMFWGQLIGNVIYLLVIIYSVWLMLSDNSTLAIEFLIFLGIGAVNMAYYLFWLVALIKRWKFVYILTLIGAILFLGAMFALTAAISMRSTFCGTLLCGGPFSVIGLIYFFLALNMGADFAFDEYRIVLNVDTDVKTGATLMERGRRYAEQGLWAKAAVHFRRAAYQMPENADTHLSLVVAYINLDMYDMALEPLEKARELDRLNPKINELAVLLEKRRNEA